MPKTQEIIQVDINNLKGFEGNPRKVTKSKLNLLRNSIDKFGYVEMIVVDEDNKIISGHQRVRVMKEMGKKEVKAVKIKGYNLNEKKALSIRLNKQAGEFDNKALGEWLKDIKIEDIDVELTGFDIGDLEVKFDDIFPAEEDNFNPDEINNKNLIESKLGEVYQLGKHRLI